MGVNKHIWTLLICLLLSQANAQSDSSAIPKDSVTAIDYKKRLRRVNYAAGGLYVVSMVGLYHLWYANSELVSFHWFDDNKQWLQVDKVGHAYSAYHIARTASRVYYFAGVPEEKSVYWGAAAGFIFLTPIEFFDGFSATYGASWGDLVANTIGCAMLPAQYALWKEERIQFKWSFSRSGYAHQRPNLLGRNLQEEMLKDYNGQTYWLAVSPGYWEAVHKATKWPKWLNIAVGYGGDQMVYADPTQNSMLGWQHSRQWYLAPDVRFTAIKSNSKWVRSALFLLDMIHLPSPALEYRVRGQQFIWHWVHF